MSSFADRIANIKPEGAYQVLAQAQELERQGTVVYVMRYASRLDYFLFNTLFLRAGLRLSRFANGIRFHYYRPLLEFLRISLGRRPQSGPERDRGFVRDLARGGQSFFLFLRTARLTSLLASREQAVAQNKSELDLLEAWRERGITKSELAWAKRYLVRSHAFAVDTASKRAGLKLDAELYGLPPGYYERYTDSIKGVTLEAANQAIQQRISTEALQLVVVGTESQIGEAIRGAIPKLAHSEVIPYDAD